MEHCSWHPRIVGSSYGFRQRPSDELVDCDDSAKYGSRREALLALSNSHDEG